MDENSQSLYIYNGSYYTDRWHEWLAFPMLRISMFVKEIPRGVVTASRLKF